MEYDDSDLNNQNHCQFRFFAIFRKDSLQVVPFSPCIIHPVKKFLYVMFLDACIKAISMYTKVPQKYAHMYSVSN